jgi:lipid-A-disaccharide synthase-like uncharacterized protein
MKETQLWVFAVGMTAQFLFGARMIVQWFQSEKAGKSLSPTIFWQLSILGSIIFLIYGILRKDFAIVLGQCLVYYIYIRNLHLKNSWTSIPLGFRWLIIILPVLTLGFLFSNHEGNIFDIITNKDISLWLKIWGSVGQVVFILRFYFQWIESESKKESILSLQFWLISILGGAMILSYAFFRRDPVLFLGQLAGLLIYIRNLIFIIKTENSSSVTKKGIFDQSKPER